VDADPVVIMGTFWRTSFSNKDQDADKKIQIHSVCQAIEGAQALGHEVVLLTPNITCGGKQYPGRCPNGGECTHADIQRELTVLAGRMPKGEKQNLLIQTVGHGTPDMSPSWDEDRGPAKNRLGIGPRGLSAKEFGEILKKSGIIAKSNRIRGLWTQCYSGGWNELATLVSPSGKFCSVSQALHNQTADVNPKEYEKLGGSGLVLGFWRAQQSSKGQASIQESTAIAAHHKKFATEDLSWSEDWRSSSIYLSEKVTRTGAFYPRTSNDDFPTEPPKAYFADGYNVDDLKIYRAFEEATRNTEKKTDGIRERYKNHLSEVDNFNRDKWFWQDEKKANGAYLLRSAACLPEFESPLSGGNQSLLEAMEEIREKVEGEDFAKVRGVLTKKLDQWEKARTASEKLLLPEVKRYHERNNSLLLRSGTLLRKIELGEEDPTNRNQLAEEYAALEKEFSQLGRLEDFPKLREQLIVEKQVQQLGSLLRLIQDKNIDKQTKDRILSTWECENSPLFTSKGPA
jgi:hypothetical protein